MSDTRTAVIGAIGVGAIAAASFFSGGEPETPTAAPSVAVATQQDQAAAERHPGREAAKARARERMNKRLEREAKERGRPR